MYIFEAHLKGFIGCMIEINSCSFAPLTATILSVVNVFKFVCVSFSIFLVQKKFDARKGEKSSACVCHINDQQFAIDV